MAAKFKVSDEVRDVLKRSELSETIYVGFWTLRLPEQLERRLYQATMKVIDGAGGSWDRRLELHVFKGDPRVALGLAVETGVATNEQQARQSFYSPPAVASEVADRADLDGPGPYRILEPSAGLGALVRAAHGHGLPETSLRFVCIENDHEAVRALRESGLADEVHELDFLTADFFEDGFFDRVLMNPPWSKGQDVAHVLHALRFLRPGGILVAVMPASADPSILSPGGRGKKETKRAEWVRVCREHDYDWFPLPDGSFRESGTDVKCGIVRMERPQ